MFDPIMRHWKLSCGLLVTGLIVAVVWLSAFPTASKECPVTVSLWLPGFTNDASGNKLAFLICSKRARAIVIPRSFDHKTEEGAWVTNLPIPPTLEDDLVLLAGDGYGGQVRFPTNATWKLRMYVIEPRRGIAGLWERISHHQDYRGRGGWLNVLTGKATARWTGQSYWLETEEIPYEVPERRYE
jgi:hypothetical protein